MFGNKQYRIILAIDPGPSVSGVVVYDNNPDAEKPVLFYDAEMANDVLIYKIVTLEFATIYNANDSAIEMITGSYGQPIDINTCMTIMWIGRLVQALITAGFAMPGALARQTIAGYLTHGGSKTHGDKFVNAALRIRFDEPLSPKRTKGKLKGITDHAWSALAVAVTHGDGIQSFSSKRLVTFGALDEADTNTDFKGE